MGTKVQPSAPLLGALTCVLLGLATVPASALTQPFRIALVSDPHINVVGPDAAYQQTFEDAINAVNQAGVDEVLMGGDLSDGGSGQLAEFAEYKLLAAGFNAPVLAVPGNHDVGDKISPAVPNSGLKDSRLTQYANTIGPLWFSQTIAPGVRVVGATSSLMGSGLSRENDQWTFLQQNLTPAPGEQVILLMHYPAFVSDANEQDLYSNLDTGPRAQLLGMLANTGDLVLSGHLHRAIENTYDGSLMIGAPATSYPEPSTASLGWTLITLDPDGSITAQVESIPEPATSWFIGAMLSFWWARRPPQPRVK